VPSKQNPNQTILNYCTATNLVRAALISCLDYCTSLSADFPACCLVHCSQCSSPSDPLKLDDVTPCSLIASIAFRAHGKDLEAPMRSYGTCNHSDLISYWLLPAQAASATLDWGSSSMPGSPLLFPLPGVLFTQMSTVVVAFLQGFIDSTSTLHHLIQSCNLRGCTLQLSLFPTLFFFIMNFWHTIKFFSN
jgi:hypothetical protein